MASTQPLVFAAGYAALDEPGIRAYAFDVTTGALAERGAFSGVANPSFLILHPNGRWAYAVSETDGGGAVCALGVAQAEPSAPVSFRLLNQQSSGGDGPCHLVLDQTARWIVVSNYSSGSVGVLPIGDDGTLGALTDSVQHRGTGPQADRQEGPHAHSAVVSADNRFVIVADLGLDTLMVYAFDDAAGTIRLHERVATRPGAGPRHTVFDAGDRHLYVANELDNTVAVNAYDAATGAIRELQVLSTIPADAPHTQVADIHLTPDGARLLVSSRGHNSLAVYDVAADGTLALATIAPCGGDWPRNFAIAPDARFVLVANENSGYISVLPFGSGAEALAASVGTTEMPRVACVQFAQLS